MSSLTEEKQRIWRCPDCGCEHPVPASLGEADLKKESGRANGGAGMQREEQ